jgi:hypothetical protein
MARPICALFRVAVFVAIALAVLGGARADDAAKPSSPPPQLWQDFTLVDEVTLGVLAHDPMRPAEGGTEDISIESFTSPIFGHRPVDSIFAPLLNPRLNVGAAINDAGKTSFVYAGPAWRIVVFGPVFVDAEFGMALNNGYTGVTPVPGHLLVGSHVTFHEEIGLGYRLTDHFDIIGTAEHISHAGLFGPKNAGVSDFGVRIGYRF